MSRTTRVILAAAAGFVGMCLIGTFAAAAAIYREGSISISVEEKHSGGQRIHLRLPAIVARGALVLVPDGTWHEMRLKTRPWIPAIRALSTGLAGSPDGIFIHVESPGERVIIAKTGTTLVIDVDSQEESVHVSVPVRTMNALVHRLTPGS